MEQICINCIYYNPSEYHSDKKKGRGKCKCPKFVYAHDLNEEKYPLNDKLEYSDYDGYSADFYVGQNFGCIHWKKEEQ